mmetsp:Transcript_45895/g.33655  ORF Transcript_45895/g.33655 Transcript_45895/m.33655 type:complete len:104 (-) Transcript_45895:18-329(-)
MKKTHLKLQNAGEREDRKAIDQAKSSNEARKLMKHIKGRHSDINKGEDPRSYKAMLEKKRIKLRDKMRQGKRGKKEYGEKAMNKITQRSRPTRSKLIVKERKK